MTERDPTSTTIFIGGISYYSNEDRIAEVFKDCGEIKDIRMPLNEDQSHVTITKYIINFLESWILSCRICKCRFSR